MRNEFDDKYGKTILLVEVADRKQVEYEWEQLNATKVDMKPACLRAFACVTHGAVTAACPRHGRTLATCVG